MFYLFCWGGGVHLYMCPGIHVKALKNFEVCVMSKLYNSTFPGMYVKALKSYFEVCVMNNTYNMHQEFTKLLWEIRDDWFLLSRERRYDGFKSIACTQI